MRHPTHDELVLAYYAELPASERRTVREHLTVCSACAAEYAALREALALLDAEPSVEPGERFEQRVWARLQPHLRPHMPWWQRMPRVPPLRWTAAAGVAAAILVAFLAGWFARGSGIDAPPATTDAEAFAGITERVLLLAVGDHLDQSQVVLVELMNADAADEVTYAVSRSHASDLVAANRLYRQTAAQAGDDTLAAVLAELERVLIEIANAPADDEAGTVVAGLRDHVEEGGILFRVRVLSSEMRARELAVVDGQGSTS